MFKGYIFDIDGTLTSTNDLIFASFNHVTKKFLGKNYSNEEIIELFGPTEDFILEKLMGDKFEEAKTEYYKFYEEMHESMADSYPGIKKIVLKIKETGLPLGIYTGKGRTSSIITLKKIGLYETFDLLVSGDDVNEHKPSPEGIKQFAQKFNLDTNEILMIGDAPADIIAAKNAGAKSASVLWDSYAADTAKKLNANFYFNSVIELENFIDKNLTMVKN